MANIFLGSPSRLFGVDPVHPNRLAGSLVDPILDDPVLAFRLFGDSVPIRPCGVTIEHTSHWMQDAVMSESLTICANMCDSVFRRRRLAEAGMRFVPTGVNIAVSTVFHGPSWGQVESVEELVGLATGNGLPILGDTDEIGPQRIAEETTIGREMSVVSVTPFLTGMRSHQRTDIVLIHGILAPLFCQLFEESGLRPRVNLRTNCGFAPLGLFVNDMKVAKLMARRYRDARSSIESDPTIRLYKALGLLEVVPVDAWPAGCVELLAD